MSAEQPTQYLHDARKVTRRKFVVGSFAATALLLGGSEPTYPSTTNDPGEIDFSGTDVGSTIRNYEERVGTQLLTYDQARYEVLPLLTEFVRQNIPTKKTTKEILSDIVLIRKSYSTENAAKQAKFDTLFTPNISHDPVITQIKKDYPRLFLSDTTMRIIMSSIAGDATGLMHDGKIYITFDQLNTQNNSIVVGNKLVDLKQYEGVGDAVACSTPTPISNLRSVFFHEYIHYEGKKDGVASVPAEPSLLAAFTREVRTTKPGFKDFQSGIKSNFALLGRTNTHEAISETDTNEFVTDYLAANISIANSLP